MSLWPSGTAHGKAPDDSDVPGASPACCFFSRGAPSRSRIRLDVRAQFC
ncbi:hypothetical protein [uncultured Desulfovibrio sp.]|nr:hypothetical protein [uncultured Desulfovibrio sp.]